MDIPSHFDKLVDRYDKYSSLSKSDELKQILVEFLPSGQNAYILDVGTGTGNFGALFGNNNSFVVGFDLTHTMLVEARKKRLHPTRGRATQLPFKDQTFDIVLARQVLQYLTLDEINKTLAEIYRCLNCNGKIIIHHISAPDTVTINAVSKFMAVNDRITTFLDIDDFETMLRQNGFNVTHSQLHSCRISETVEDFAKIRNIPIEKISDRLNIYQESPFFDISEKNQEISYLRHYALIVATAFHAS